MTGSLRLFFDVCCSTSLPRELFDLFRHEVDTLETRHLLEGYRADSADSKWLAELQADQSWIVITCDRGCDNAKEKLPLICRELKITHVMFTAALLKQGKMMQKIALITVWQELMKLHRLPRGTGLKLGHHQAKGGVNTFMLRLPNGKKATFPPA